MGTLKGYIWLYRVIYWGYIGIMEKKMETSIGGSDEGFRIVRPDLHKPYLIVVYLDPQSM